MKRETQQESSKDKDGEEKHGISNKSYSPPLSPLVFPQTHNKQSSSTSPSSSPLHDSSPTHEEIYHTNEFRLTPPENQTNHSQFVPPPPAVVAKAKASQKGVGAPEEAQEGGENKTSSRPYSSILKRERRQNLVRRAMLGLRISGFVCCLISFSVMAADKKQGWASDSYSNYKEFRYCLAVNVLGFVYSGIQTYDLVYYFTTGKHVVQHYLRYYFDFLMDQILTYLVISASSSAATRVEDWESNWGKDKFPDMARASVALSFLAFFAFASSSLISGYTLCTLKAM
ncbi:CASP-like protein 4A3 [Argentina anserina]|uniref:CASP-like protein 4A3 n=1 Tax=Argentina anserina TaxID=57926 RepID=UPI0021764DB8|nr:CASP-like protein 4A3 [Potentilla anserina]